MPAEAKTTKNLKFPNDLLAPESQLIDENDRRDRGPLIDASRPAASLVIAPYRPFPARSA